MTWRELVGRLYDDVTFATPASDEEIDGVERHLGQPVPGELRGLLRETDGVRADYGSGLVWSVAEIITGNTRMRDAPELAELYMSFDQLMFMGDNGGGDQFAYVRGPAGRPEDVFVWDHETDERRWVARSLADYLERRAGADGDDWYR